MSEPFSQSLHLHFNFWNWADPLLAMIGVCYIKSLRISPCEVHLWSAFSYYWKSDVDPFFLSLFSTEGIVHLDASAVQGLFTTKGDLGDNHAPTFHPSIGELYPEMLIYSGRPPREYSPLQVGNMNHSSMKGRKQLDQRKLIRKAGFSPIPSKSPGKPVRPMRPWKPGTRGQGWDPGGQRPSEQPFPQGQSGIRPWPDSHSRTRPSKCLLFTSPSRHYISRVPTVFSLVFWYLKLFLVAQIFIIKFTILTIISKLWCFLFLFCCYFLFLKKNLSIQNSRFSYVIFIHT